MAKLLERLGRVSDERDGGLDEDGLYGLFQLWPLKEEGYQVQIQETSIDMVAVHGLNGNPLKTWTDGDKLWLADFLPQDIPFARVFTYGYNSGLAFTGSSSRVEDYARTHLQRLIAKRRQFAHQDKRPLIFVCHSLGGVIHVTTVVIPRSMWQPWREIKVQHWDC
ncbi:hypothetical protein N0V82_005117 [Gnomoniopsis sp. IMI 355080]|nr:hypothetical protein N0V82_005117 [Gnomoniopsis sp. IMI 355080]